MNTKRAPRVIMVVLDGLRPAMIDRQRMPHLSRLRDRGTTYAESRTVFPSMTRVAVASFATGAPPSLHGVVANAFYAPGYDPCRVHDFSTNERIAAFEHNTFITLGDGFACSSTDNRTCGLLAVAPTVLDLMAVPPTLTMADHSVLGQSREACLHRHTLKRGCCSQFIGFVRSGNATYLQRAGRVPTASGMPTLTAD